MPRQMRTDGATVEKIGNVAYLNGTAISNVDSYSLYDRTLLALGAKMSPTTKTTSPLEWNGKVVALLGGLLGMMVVCGGLIWYAATLASQVNYLDKTIQKMENTLNQHIEAEQQKSIKDAEIRGAKIQQMTETREKK